MTLEIHSSGRPTNYSGPTGGTPEKVRAVMAAILQMWPNAKIDPKDPAGVWGGAIGHLSSEQIRYGIAQISRLDREYALNPGQFSALAMSFRAPRPKRATELPDDSPKTAAWRETCQQFAAKLNGPGYEYWPRSPVDFPISIVIADVPYDEEKRKAAIAAGLTVNRRFDDELFERLKVAFEYRWVQHQEPNSPAGQGYGR